MEDPKKPNIQPVVNSAEAWHLAQVHAFEHAATLVKSSLEDGSQPSLEEFCGLVVEQLNDEAGNAWQTFLRFSDRPNHVAERSSVLVGYQENRSIPTVEWPDDGSAGWGMVDVSGVDGPDMALAVPFRPVALDRLPPERLIVKICDQHHAATAALVEILQCAKRDATNSFIAPDLRSAWRRLNCVINVYRQAARMGLEALNEDDFNGWRPTVPMGFEFGSAAGLICQIASTARAQIAMATHLMSLWLQSLADVTEEAPAEERKNIYMKRLKDACHGMETALEGMNQTLARDNWVGSEPFDCMVVFRPVPRSIPLLVMIPRTKKSNVKRLARKAKK